MAIVTIDNTSVAGGSTAPDAPTSLTTEREWDGVRLHWTNPAQRDVDYIEIWRNTSITFSGAQMVAQVKGNDYVDHSLETGTRYYWIRAVNTVGLESVYHPLSSANGVEGNADQVNPSGAVDRDVLQYNSATATWTTGALRTNTRLAGEMQATTEPNYVWPTSSLVTVSDNNGYSAASSLTGLAGNSAAAAYYHYYGDTLAGTNASPVLNFRAASGNSVAGVTVPFTGLTSVAPSAVTTAGVTGVITFNGYATTGFGNDIATTYQGGGNNSLHSVQIQAFPSETFSDSILTVSAANITAISSFRPALGAPTVTGTKGQISFTSTTPAVGQAVRVTGLLIGNATGIVSGNTYYIIATNGSTTATLSATPGGLPITTSGTTLTGLTLTRCSFTLTLSGQTKVPFGRGALVAVSGITNIADGTYPVWGTPTTTSVSIGAPHTVDPALSGTQALSCRTAYMAGGYRVRAFPLATPTNMQNRLELVSHTAASATFRADSFTIAGGSYGTTGTTRAVIDATKAAFSVPVAFPVYTKAQAVAITGAVGWQICISDSAGGGNPNGMMAFWDTTNARWSYIHDNTAV